MTVIRAEETRIPRHARDAVDRHEKVVVLSHDRPAFVIVHPDEYSDDNPDVAPERRGRRLGEALRLLGSAATPDPEFGDDLEAIHNESGSMPDDPWAH